MCPGYELERARWLGIEVLTGRHPGLVRMRALRPADQTSRGTPFWKSGNQAARRV